MGQLPDLQSLIADELKKDKPDWRLVERLSRDAVDADPNSVRFSVDAGHIQRLGFELVAKQETALAELIKNCYDADATQVSVLFSNHDKPGGTLVIEDNGMGMNHDVVRDAWMRISTTSKRDSPVSPRYGRVRAGKKGIGRFAVQRLGTKLILETEVAGKPYGLRVKFDWDTQFLPGRHLHEVFSEVDEYDKPIDGERTRLSIFGLREGWSEPTMQRVWKAVLLLQPPFPVSRAHPLLAVGHQQDPGFEVTINGLSSRKQRTNLSIETSFLDHAIAEIRGHIDEHGNAYVRVVSKKLSLDERQTYEERLLATGPLTFSVKYFIYSPDALSGLSFATATEMAKNFAGVRIYRDGFRVLPYGEPADDWLGFDRDAGRRQVIVPSNNRNFFGQIELSSNENPLFEETSSREGLIENEVFEDLRSFVRYSLEWAILRVASIRGRKTTASQKDYVSKARPRKPSQILGNLLESIGSSQAAHGGSASTKDSTASLPPATLAAFASAREEAENYEKEVEEQRAASLKYEEMLRILASLGLSITVFGHEIKGIRSSVAAHISALEEEISILSDLKGEAPLTDLVSGLKLATGRMFDLGGYIAGLMSSTESRELRSLSVSGSIERFIGQFQQYMDRQAIEFTSDIEPLGLRTTAMHASEIDSVLLNFLTNSIKSMKKANSHPRRIRVFAREDGEYVLLGFEDNGAGVSPEIEERIFEPFYTTTMGLEDDDVAGPGTGLGLKIVSDIANSYGGYVSLGTPSTGYTCSFEFRILSAHAAREA
ncbi:ATP-binding protein [Magnetospirillum sp. 64-120]|uniref:sensor histidine kinase n=1 Tax=Magnetospirillum sp. 64-120 TaxID=1895778 RepID=UPI000929E1C5|nr:ATP-binding protein [Magnetospirillum sp. 64-120]OJX71896.1 MAG: hypothetical protein BGO92_04435 [Magnetospirillum sp. 64-120]